MNIHRLSKIVNGKIVTKNKKDIVFKACIDSRELIEGGIFIIIGDVYKYKEDILKKASVVIGEYSLGKKVGFIKVEDSIQALKDLAKYNLDKNKLKVIAITGSNGKTTLKELVSCVLKTKYKVLKNKGNENNLIGVSKTLLRLDDSYDYCVLELGMNHKNEISELSLLVKPYYALITNIGTAHIGNLGSKKNIFQAKMEILDGMDINNIIVNGDDKYLKHLKCLKVGNGLFNDLKIQKIKLDLQTTSFACKIKNKKYNVLFSYGGLHYPDLIGMALLLGLELDISLEEGIKAIQNFSIVGSRLEIINLNNNNYLINDCYNASYESFMNVISLSRTTKQKKLFIIGDILEAGEYSDSIHLKIMKELKKIKNTEVWIVGEYFNKYKNILKNSYSYSKEEIINKLSTDNLKDTIIIVKASHKFNLDEVCSVILNKY